MTTKRTAPVTCAICNCKGNVLLHNINAINKVRQDAKDAATHACPKCGNGGNELLIQKWGHCMQCQKASQSAKYGF